MLPSLARHSPTVVQFSQQPQHSCRRFLFFCGISSFSWAFYLVVCQPCGAAMTLIPCFTARFLFIELILRRMPFFTRKSRTSTCQKFSARLSENGTMLTLFLPWILLFFDTLRPRDKDGSDGVAALWSGFCARSLLSCW